ncbi:DUF5615 family PIN-like protein [Phormidium sp. LEGE 05292]|uniref:DUF5615 family PIN-like protein n=1 Tax=[Phormidium] sp. LEGE 05292 TaxID=767427 RepID=UPI0018811811|nr:DUF5615 family PIN-like protein [Phormidium sp. LEGE 05292]MBE9229852.1 DUF5615 family PIN-like protein [Phormidium sp. LEGE 05292]
MLRFLADDNFNYHLIQELQNQQPELDILCLKDISLSGIDDSRLLELASQEGRVLLTNDVSTITEFANQRIAAGLSMPGIFVVSIDVNNDRAIADILLLAECSNEGEWEGQIRYLPLA